MRRLPVLVCLTPLILLSACSGDGASNEKCNADSTMAVVQQIIENRGCTASTCHGAPSDRAGGGLDLRPLGFYENLINVASSSSDFPLVFPAEEERSVLYLKVAAKTLGTSLADAGVAGSPMPTSDQALTREELEVIRAWIRGGAPRVGVVKDAPDPLGCEDALDPTPNKIPPLPPPAADVGIQLQSGGWKLGAESEDEVCYVTYYDYSEQVPESAKLPCPDEYGGSTRECFSYSSLLLAQDPQSHHSIVEAYVPPAENPEQWDPLYPVWKNWQCVGGESAGTACDPTSAGACGPGSRCATEPLTSIACIGYQNGPRALGTALGFFGRAASRLNIAIAQEGTLFEEYPEGVYGVLPLKGFTLWNSHSFNLTKFETTVDQYINLTFATPEERVYQREDLTILDDIFAMGTVPPFTSVEACATFTMPVGSRLMTLSSHTHKFGRDFRIWYPPNEPCEAGPGCLPPEREPEYRSFLYQDPLYQRFESKDFDQLDAPGIADRTFRYCAIWDNGESDPLAVRKHSDRPDANSCGFGEVNAFVGKCGCDPEDRACLGGPNQGMRCNGDDSVCGEGGVCDACPVWGGVTTEEEMFGILGAFHLTD